MDKPGAILDTAALVRGDPSMDIYRKIHQLVLPRYSCVSAAATVRPFGGGLINQTYLIEEGGRKFVLQKVNAIFAAAVHENIEAVTAHLERQGMATPRLIRNAEGGLCLDLEAEGVWRVLTHMEGVSYDVIGSAAQARAAGGLVGRFHRALDDFNFPFVGQRTGVHDTPAHLLRLQTALGEHSQHRLFAEVEPLAAAILEAAAGLPPLPQMPDRTGHGDLKFNNILFSSAASASAEPLCLVDLDTVGGVSLAFELGDAWRSWCNRSGENNPSASFDFSIFEASLAGYCQGLGRPPTQLERRALLLGLDWVSVELASRFAADALNESYFGWDPTRFPGRGEHNLLRARGQFSLHAAVIASRAERAELLQAE
jgi:Ser/Thr protein kinase RdoA (MazF antagonist)